MGSPLVIFKFVLTFHLQDFLFGVIHLCGLLHRWNRPVLHGFDPELKVMAFQVVPQLLVLSFVLGSHGVAHHRVCELVGVLCDTVELPHVVADVDRALLQLRHDLGFALGELVGLCHIADALLVCRLLGGHGLRIR